MWRFFSNIFICLLLIGLLIYFFIARVSPDYEAGWVSKFDHAIQALVAAILFLVLLFVLVKPSIEIASSIVEIPAAHDVPSHLRIKIVNHSLFAAYDLNVYIYRRTRVNLSGSDIKSSLVGHYHGRQEGASYLQSAFIAMFESTKTNAAQLRFRSLRDNADAEIREILESQASYLEIHIVIRHGLSGLEGNFVKKYHHIKCIKSGIYEHGFSTKINS
jgi:hypothetical protein